VVSVTDTEVHNRRNYNTTFRLTLPNH